MPGPNEVMDKGFQFNSAVSQFYAVHLVDAETATVADGSVPIFGICQEEIETRDIGWRVGNVRPLGISRAVASGAIGLMDPVSVDSANPGQVKAAGVGETAVGYCLTVVTVAGSHIDLFLTPAAQAPTN